MGVFDDLDMLIPGRNYNLLQKGTNNVIKVEFIQTTPGGGIKVKIHKNNNVVIIPDALDKFEITPGWETEVNMSYDRNNRYIPWMGGSRRRGYGGRKRKTRCKKSSKRRCRKSSRRRR
jgi:hypothetical protein